MYFNEQVQFPPPNSKKRDIPPDIKSLTKLKQDKKETTPQGIIMKLLKTNNKEKSKKASKGEKDTLYTGQ